LSREWLEKWKEYTNYAYIKKNAQYSYYYQKYSNVKWEPKPESNPGEIDNSKLLVPLSDFLNDADENNRENQVIRHDLDQKKEIKIVNKKIWDFFHDKYKGGPLILKGVIEEKQRYSHIPKKIVELYYRKVKLK
jgi:hypothetical protein